MDNIPKLIKEGLFEDVEAALFGQRNKIDKDVCIPILKACYARVTKPRNSQHELSFLCDIVSLCCKNLQRLGISYADFRSVMPYLYHIINKLLSEDYIKVVTVAEDFYKTIVYSKWWKFAEKPKTDVETQFYVIVQNLSVALWNAAQRNSHPKKTFSALCLMTFKMTLLCSDKIDPLALARTKKLLKLVNDTFQRDQNAPFVKEMIDAVKETHLCNCNSKCGRTEKLAWLLITLIESFTNFDRLIDLKTVFNWDLKKLITFDNLTFSNDCSSCGISKNTREIWNFLMEILLASYGLRVGNVSFGFLEEWYYVEIFGKVSGETLQLDPSLIRSLLRCVANGVFYSEDLMSNGKLRHFNHMVRFAFLALDLMPQQDPKENDFRDEMSTLFGKYCVLISTAFENPEIPSKDFEEILEVLNYGFNALVKRDQKLISNATYFYNVICKLYNQRRNPHTVEYCKAFCNAIYQFADIHSAKSLLIDKFNAVFLLQSCYLSEKRYSDAMDACARCAFIFGLQFPKEVFDAWLRIKKSIVQDKVIAQNEHLLYRNIGDHLELCRDLKVTKNTMVQLLYHEMFFYPTKLGDYYPCFSNYAAVKIISLLEAPCKEKALAQWFLCVSTNSRGKPETWDYEEICKESIGVLKKIETDDMRLRTAMAYYSLWKFRSDKLKSEIYEEEVKNHERNNAKPKGDVEPPDRCDIESAYKHFNLITEIHTLKPLVKFCSILSSVLFQEEHVTWHYDLDAHHQNVLMDMAFTAADIFTGATMVREAVEALGILLRLSDILDRKIYWVEAVLKLMEIMIANGMASAALSICPEVESRIAEASKIHDTEFVEHFLMILKAEAHYANSQLEEGIKVLKVVLSKIFVLSDRDASTATWIIIKCKAFLLLSNYKKASALATVAPSAAHVGDRAYLSLSPLALLLKATEWIKTIKTDPNLFARNVADYYNLSYKQYMNNLYVTLGLESGVNYVDLGVSREARTCLSQALVQAKINMKIMMGAKALLQLAFLDLLCDQKIDCDVKTEGLFYMFTYDRLEPLNSTLMIPGSSPQMVFQDSKFTLSQINPPVDDDLLEYDEDIFLSDWHKMKLKKRKLPVSFHHPQLCLCNYCKYLKLEESYLEALTINAKTLIMENKPSEALSLLQVVKTHLAKINIKNGAFIKDTLKKIANTFQFVSDDIMNSKLNSITSLVVLDLNVRDTLIECYASMKQFGAADELTKSTTNKLEDNEELLPQMRAKLYYRQALVTLHHNCHWKKISVHDWFKFKSYIPSLSLDLQNINVKTSPTLAKIPQRTVVNAPKKSQSIYSKVTKLPLLNEASAPNAAPKMKGRPSKNVLKQKNDQSDVVVISSDCVSSPDLGTDSKSKNVAAGTRKKATKSNYRSSDSSSVSPVKNSTSSQGNAKPPLVTKPRKFFKQGGLNTKKENKAPESNSKSTSKTTRLKKDAYTYVFSDLSSSDDETFEFRKPIPKTSRTTKTKPKAQSSDRVTRSGRLTREIIRSDETSSPSKDDRQSESDAPTKASQDAAANRPVRNAQKDEQFRAFRIFEDDVTKEQAPNDSSENVGKILETLLLKAKSVMQHYPDCVLYGQINFLLALVYYQSERFSQAGYEISNSVSSMLHQLWSSTLQISRLNNPSVVNLSQITKEETLYMELYQEKETSSLETDFIPPDWTVVQINLLTCHPIMYDSRINETLPLVVTRYAKNKKPLVNIVKVTDEQFRHSFWQNFKNFFVGNNNSLTRAQPRKWWDERKRLDTELEGLCGELETHWLRFYKCFILGKPISNAEALQGKQACRKFLRDCKNKDIVCKSPESLEVLMAAGSVISREECLEAVAELFDVTCPQTFLELRESLFSHLKNIKTDHKRHPVFLILDKNLHIFPWESMSILRNSSVFRIPSLLCLKTQLKAYELEPLCLVKKGMDATHGFAIMNPHANLPNSETLVTPFVKSATWENITGRAPEAQEMITAATNYDLYFYCGHGSGSVFLGRERIEQNNCRAAVVLMGCSSGKLSNLGCLEPIGVALMYLLGGCPLVMGNLWDVTDVDIDKFTLEMFDKWLVKQEGDSEEVPYSVKLGKAMTSGRNSCKMRYIVGAAPVVYGFPTDIVKYLRK